MTVIPITATNPLKPAPMSVVATAPLLFPLPELAVELLPDPAPVAVPLAEEARTGTEVPEALARHELAALGAERELDRLMVALPLKSQDVEALLVFS